MPDRLPTNLRTLMILEAIANSTEAPSPASIGRSIGLPKQTVHRLCNTLVAEGFLAKDEKDGRLRAGRRARELASGLLHSSSAHIARHQILQHLADAIGETVNFVMPEAQGMSYKDRIETNWAFRIQLPIGSHVPFHCTASGKTYLASLPRPERKRLVNVMKLDRMTQNTICNADEMLAELAQVTRQGYAIDNEEFIQGMVAIAVPVFDTSKKYVASLAFHGPVQRISIENAIARADDLRHAARNLEAVMFS